jgi:hypothetical protein
LTQRSQWRSATPTRDRTMLQQQIHNTCRLGPRLIPHGENPNIVRARDGAPF